MSMGGAMVAIKEEKLKEIMLNQEQLESFIFDENNEKSGEISICTMEQAWDAIRILLSDERGDGDLWGFLDSEDKELPLGESGVWLDKKQTRRMAEYLEKINQEKLEELFNSDDYQQAEFYWEEVWKDEDNKEDLFDFILNLKVFAKKTVEENKILLFYVA